MSLDFNVTQIELVQKGSFKILFLIYKHNDSPIYCYNFFDYNYCYMMHDFSLVFNDKIQLYQLRANEPVLALMELNNSDQTSFSPKVSVDIYLKFYEQAHKIIVSHFITESTTHSSDQAMKQYLTDNLTKQIDKGIINPQSQNNFHRLTLKGVIFYFLLCAYPLNWFTVNNYQKQAKAFFNL